MGASWSAAAVLGVRLQVDKLYVNKVMKRGEHDFGMDIKFHPQTGKPLWETVKYPIEMFSYAKGKLGVYDIVYSSDESYCFIGGIVSQTGSVNNGEHCKKTDLRAWGTFRFDEIYKAMSETLPKYGVEFDPNDYGLWAVLQY